MSALKKLIFGGVRATEVDGWAVQEGMDTLQRREAPALLGDGGLELDGDEVALLGTGPEPLQKTLIPGWRQAEKPVFSTVDPLDLELLTRLDLISAADLRGQNDLALAGNGNPHRH